MTKQTILIRILIPAATIGTILLTVPASYAAPRQASQKQVLLPATSLIIDQKSVKMHAPPLLIKNNLLLPAKSFFDIVGAQVSLEKDKFTVSKGDVRVEGKLNSLKATKGKITIVLPTAPTVLNSRLYVPARIASLVLDKEISYDHTKRQIRVGFSDAQMYQFQKLLYESARNGDVATLKKMLSRGVNVNLKLVEEFGDHTVLDYAIMSNRTEAVQILLDQQGIFNPDLSSEAIRFSNVKMLELLLKHGLDPNYKLSLSRTILSVASGIIHVTQADGSSNEIRPNIQIVNMLLEYGADPSNDDSLAAAVTAANYEIIQALLNKGADPNRPDSFGVTPYERAQSMSIGSWIKPDPAQKTPVLTIQYNDGTPVQDGQLIIKNTRIGSNKEVIYWSGKAFNLGVPDGEYLLTDFWQRDTSYMFPLNTLIRITQGVVEPTSLRLPKINVKGTINGSTKENQVNTFLIANNNSRTLSSVHVVEGRFNLALPPGSYLITAIYSSQQKFNLKGPTQLTISEDSPVQELTYTIQ
ncbi:ankyrin repeat domain-containing protein [Paenibacillus sp. YPG26]|uniref:stalk domain-containing protein n=1 Tax=Paenibacillus sp. YPG26 TaxID=2878915 RepID=UPI00203E92FA|nr:ankyrin repeat domain-containing protein [Paenibacillus sp. YPG26]USB31656.1 ankyrin repeat domain-containing protein [Paenibacillus sp. YPG26]